MSDPTPPPVCLRCEAHQARKRFFWSRKFWCVILGMSVPPAMYGVMELPPLYVALMMFPPMAWGFGEWMLDFVKEVTKMLTVWKQAGMPLLPGVKDDRGT